jgi:hypothetical protein
MGNINSNSGIRWRAVAAGAIILAGGALWSQNQDQRITAIRALSAKIESQITLANKEAEGGSPSGFYCTEVFLNSRNGSWRAVGNYYRKTLFWHTDEPRFAVQEERTGAAVLVKVETHEGAAITSLFKDFLFDEGKLVFAYVQTRMGEGPMEERRYYFDGGRLIRFMLGQKISAEAPDGRDILSEAARQQALFLTLYQ